MRPLRDLNTNALAQRWRLPRVGASFVPVVGRNLLVWRKMALASVLGNIAEPLIVLVAFGYGLGALIGPVQGIPYMVFLASGSICMSTMHAASFEAMYSAYSRMHVQHTWDGILNSPVTLDEIVFAEILWAALKSVFTATSIAVVLFAVGISTSPLLLAAIPVLFVVGLTFSALAMVFTALARGYDFFTYYFTLVLTPMTFISGVYFPASQLPPWLAAVAQALPLTAAVELVRPMILGQWPDRWLMPLGTLLACAALGYLAAAMLIRRRFLRQ